MTISRLPIVAVCCLFVSQVHGGTILTDPGPLSTNVIGFFGLPLSTLGYGFTVHGGILQVNTLGVWDENSDGLQNSHVVGIWDNGGSLLGQVTIAAGTADSLANGFRYVTLAQPVILAPGVHYVLGATYLSHDADTFRDSRIADNRVPTYDPVVEGGNARISFPASSLAFPDNSAGPGALVGPNAQFTILATPELGPGLLILAVTFVGLFVVRKGLPASRNSKLGGEIAAAVEP